MSQRGPISTGIKAVDRVFQTVWNAIASIEGGVADVRRQVQRLEDFERQEAGDLRIFKRYEQEAVGGAEYGVARVWFRGRIGRVAKVEYRAKVAGNLTNADAWSGMTFHTSAGTEYPHGYFEESVLLDQESGRNSVLEWRAVDVQGFVVASDVHSFDPDIDPEFTSIHLALGAYDGAHFPLFLIYALDEDGQSIEYGLPEVALIEDLPIPDALFTGQHFAAYSNGLHIADLEPEEEVYVVARARERADGTGKKGSRPFRGRIKAPVAPGTVTIPDGSIIGSKLVQASQRYSTTLAFAPDSTLISSRITWGNAQISFVGGDTYNVSAGFYDLPAGVLTYIYFDSDASTTSLQFTQTYSDAISDTGSRVLIGVARPGDTASDYLFFSTGIQPIVSPALVYAASLQALFARIDDLTVKDSLVFGDGAEILNGAVDFTAGVGIIMEYNGGTPRFRAGNPAGQHIKWDGSSLTVVGSVFITSGSGLANLSDAGALALKDTVDWSSDVVGSGKPADNATVGATWGVNLANIPARLSDTPSSAGLYLSPTHMGYYNGSAWKTYMDSSGNFFLDGSGNHSLSWNAATSQLTVAGNITAHAGTIWGLTVSGHLNLVSGGDFYSGTTAYDTGAGFWLGNTGGTTKLFIGSASGNKLTWDGSSLALVGDIDAIGTFASTDGIFSTIITGGTVSVDGGAFEVEIAPSVFWGHIRFDDGAGNATWLGAGSGELWVNSSSNTIWHAGNFPLNLSGASAGKVLKFNGTHWVPDTDATGGGGSMGLGDLTDVNLSGLMTGDIIRYAGAGTGWVRVAVSSLTIAASQILASGQIPVSTVPNLPASIITSGTFGTDRIPDLAASKITSGIFDEARIPHTWTTNLSIAGSIVLTQATAPYKSGSAVVWPNAATSPSMIEAKNEFLQVTAGGNTRYIQLWGPSS